MALLGLGWKHAGSHPRRRTADCCLLSRWYALRPRVKQQRPFPCLRRSPLLRETLLTQVANAMLQSRSFFCCRHKRTVAVWPFFPSRPSSGFGNAKRSGRRELQEDGDCRQHPESLSPRDSGPLVSTGSLAEPREDSRSFGRPLAQVRRGYQPVSQL